MLPFLLIAIHNSRCSLQFSQSIDDTTDTKMGEQQFFLKWNDFQNNMVSSFKHLRDEKSFTDVSSSKFRGRQQFFYTKFVVSCLFRR